MLTHNKVSNILTSGLRLKITSSWLKSSPHSRANALREYIPRLKQTNSLLYKLLRDLAEEHVHPIERHRAAADYRTRRDRAPQDVGAGELPDCQQRGQHRDKYAGAGNPEGDASDQAGIEIAAACLAWLRFGQDSSPLLERLRFRGT